MRRAPVLALAATLAGPAALLGAQARSAPPRSAPPRSAPAREAPPPSAAVGALDRWIIARYRGAGLFPDTVGRAPALASTRTPPRIEGVSPGPVVDTLWAVHFASDGHAPALAVNTMARLAAPTGAVTPLAARVLARRPFRAPRVPGAPVADASRWREGWAYLVTVPHVATRPMARALGWLLLSAPPTGASSNSRS